MPYRDDQASLEARREELRKELAEATQKAEALHQAARSQEVLTRELSEVEARLRRIGGRRVPLLESVRIASPCNADWENMVGDDRVRFCGSCEKNVYNLSAMPSEEAEGLLAHHEGNLCVRLYQRADGTVLTTDCPVGVRKKRVKRLVVLAAGAGALAAAASGAFARQAQPTMGVSSMGKMENTSVPAPTVMGSVAPQPVTPPAVTGMPAVTAAPVAPTMGRIPARPRHATMGKPSF